MSEKTIKVELWGEERERLMEFAPFPSIYCKTFLAVGLMTCECGEKIHLRKKEPATCLKCGITVLSADEFEAVIKVRR